MAVKKTMKKQKKEAVVGTQPEQKTINPDRPKPPKKATK
jgi:hypothetical protein